MKYRPNAQEKAIIRKCAEGAAKVSSVKLEMGLRHNVKDESRPMSVNLLLVSDDWRGKGDTDLFDMRSWSDFLHGVETTPAGDAIVDFYVYERTGAHELATNVQAYIQGCKLVKVTEERTVLWEATAA